MPYLWPVYIHGFRNITHSLYSMHSINLPWHMHLGADIHLITVRILYMHASLKRTSSLHKLHNKESRLRSALPDNVNACPPLFTVYYVASVFHIRVDSRMYLTMFKNTKHNMHAKMEPGYQGQCQCRSLSIKMLQFLPYGRSIGSWICLTHKTCTCHTVQNIPDTHNIVTLLRCTSMGVWGSMIY
jgi:hypothetical protein